MRAPRLKGGSNSSSTNWSGYAVTGATPFTDVKGSWVEPTVTCTAAAAAPTHGKNSNSGGKGSQQTYSSFWVGLDGDVSNTVEQTGTDSDCNGTTAVYYAWYEFYPAGSVTIPNPVRSGDSMSAEVKVANGTVTTSITDQTRNWTYTAKHSSGGYALSSAEWIAEAPSGPKVLPLADFVTMSFTGASATGNGAVAGPINDSAFTDDQITMVTSSGTAKATPGPLNGAGDGFSVTWNHS
jgi:hypothetical protein